MHILHWEELAIATFTQRHYSQHTHWKLSLCTTHILHVGTWYIFCCCFVFLFLFCFLFFTQVHLTLSSFCRIASVTASLKMCSLRNSLQSCRMKSCTCAAPRLGPCIQCGYVQYFIKNSNWPSPGSRSDPVYPQHLIQHVNSYFLTVIMIDCLWCLFPIVADLHWCVHGADA